VKAAGSQHQTIVRASLALLQDVAHKCVGHVSISSKAQTQQARQQAHRTCQGTQQGMCVLGRVTCGCS
jgi:hypothetical protein